ncbi:MAG TPA: plastocyanin/azurin family copper-binding protein [Solirubrobacteraceae bacterium]|nr:plastocyanin/azurin family copper-binding protein [Solirubrobacteraceae bacterium]
MAIDRAQPLRDRWRGARTLAVLGAGSIALVALGGCSIKRYEGVNLVAGKQLFVSKCASCHTLARANAKGIVGPNLDDAFRNSLASGLERTTIRGAVRQQILFPETGGTMPADLVSPSKASDIASYVAYAVDRTGQDTGLLASAVPSAGAGKPAVEANGVLQIDADPSGQLSYVTNKATAKPGPVTVKMANMSGTMHNIALQQGTGPSGAVIGAGKIVTNGTSSFTANLKAGTYTYFCQVPGHRAAGMSGTLTVK